MAANYDEIGLAKETYDLLKRIPHTWIDEAAAVDGLVSATTYSALCVRKRLEFLRKAGLVERRRGSTIDRKPEIRRIAKE